MLENMDADEFFEWLAFYRIQPWGWEIENWRTGLLASTIHNSAGKISKKPTQPSDFIPKTSSVQVQVPDYQSLKKAFNG